MIYRFLFIVVGCIGLCSSLSGQRITATIDLETLGEDLKFDTNNIPLPNSVAGATTDLNFSPNVVFAPDSSKAFVSIPGSNKVLVLDPVSGSPLDPQPLLEVGANPGLMTLTPDGSKICVVSLLLKENVLSEEGEVFQVKEIGSIAIIDVETLQIQTLDLTEVFFSIGNNMVFSEDGSTGYIASSGTDQIIRFDVDSATEMTPRLDLTTGTRPSSLTMAPDFSFFTTILIGSSAIPPLETPDSILIVDPDSFTVTNTIVPAFGDLFLVPHNFVVSNTLAISADGQFGLLGDREFSLIGGPGFDDHALFLNLQTGEILEVLEIGGITRGSFATPDGKNFVILSDREIAIIDIESREVTRVTPPFTGFKDTTRPAFAKDKPLMYVASAVRDFLMEFDLEAGYFTRSVDLGPSLIFDNNGTNVTIPAGPLDVALSPDGTFLTAVKFNADSIVLLRNTTRLFIPQVVSNQDFFTGIAVTNNSPERTTLVSQILDTSGRPVRDDPNTEDPDFETPEDIILESSQQVSFTARELVDASEESSLRGWLDLTSDQPEIAGIFLIGDAQFRRLDGATASSVAFNEWILPEVRVFGGFRTEITIVNPTAETATVKIALVNNDGSVAEEISRSVLDNGVLTVFLRQADPQDASSPPLFSPSSFTNFVSGYVRISSEDEKVVAFERYFDNERIAALNGIPIGGGVPSPLQSYLPQFTVFGGSETFLNLIHSGTSSARVSLALKNDQGENLAGGVNLRLDPSQSIRINLVDLFGLTDPGNALTGWLLLESDSPGVVGDGELHSFSGRAMTTVPIQSSSTQRFVFPHVTQGSGISTGLAFLNPGSQSATVLVEVFTSQGAPLDDVSLMVGGSERLVGLLEDFFPDLPDFSGGYIKVSSDEDIIGLEIFFADNLDYMAVVSAHPLD